MISCSIPSGIRKLADRTKDICTGRLSSYTNLCAFFCFYFLGVKTLSELARSCPWSHSVSDLSRSLHSFDGSRFMRRLRTSILRKYGKSKLNPDDFSFALDDTDNPKYGKSIFRKGEWRGSKGQYVGQKVLVVVLVDIDRKFAIPLSYAFVAKKDDPDYKPGWELGLELLQGILDAGFPKLKVTSDSWFDGVDFIKGLRAMDLHFAGELKNNRLAKTNPGPNIKWTHLADAFSECRRERLYTRLDNTKIKTGRKCAKCGSTARIMIKNYPHMMNAVAVYNAKNSKSPFSYYASTDLTVTGARLWELSRARWKIECMFRDLKQSLSFGKIPCGGKNAADLAVCMPFYLYTSLRLDKPNMWGLKRHETIGIMLEKLRERELTKTILLISSAPNHKKVAKLKSRRSCICRKPTDQAADYSYQARVHAA